SSLTGGVIFSRKICKVPYPRGNCSCEMRCAFCIVLRWVARWEWESVRNESFLSRRPVSMGLLFLRQKSPAQGLVLNVVLAQGQRRHRLGHLVAQVKRMSRINRRLLVHRFK